MSRSSKSLWKLPYINPCFFNKSFKIKKEITTKIRSSIVPYNFQNKRIGIYNGKQNIKILINDDMKTIKLGQFSFTKRKGSNRGKDKKKGRKKR